MRVTRQTLEEHRAAIRDAASTLFRRRGIDNVSVAEVTRAAGLTHGAFYGHYPSKTALAEDAMAVSLRRGAEHWRRRGREARANGRDGLAAIIASYLSEAHRDAPERGCALAALGPELARAEPGLRDALAGGVEALLGALISEIESLHPALAPEEHARRAFAVLAAMSGGLMLARVFGTSDRSRDALRAAAAAARAAADR